jgi:hypothetical protein
MSQANASSRESEVVSEGEVFSDFVKEHFDAAYYRECYNDVAISGLDPLEHWLDRGFAERRQISRSIILRYGNVAKRSSSRIWKHYRWRNEDIAVRLIKPIPPEVLAQIVRQTRHDKTVLAAGEDSITQLSIQDRENVHLNVAGLQRALPFGTEFLLIVPDPHKLKEQGLVAGLVLALSNAGFRSIQTIVVDQESRPDHEPSAITDNFRSNNVLFWHDFWIHGPEGVKLRQLAQMISVLRPRVTIVADSRRGYEMTALYGRALAKGTKMYCIYTVGAEDFAPLTLPFAAALTDDIEFADRLRDQYSRNLGHGVVTLPHHSEPSFDGAVTDLFGRP